MPRLVIEALSKRYGDLQALEDVSLTVEAGEIYGFVGSNGAGKSTTMRIALGVLAADHGAVYLDGQEIDSSLRRRIGYMPEERGLYANEPLLDQLVFFACLHGIGKKDAIKRAHELLERLDLDARAGDKLETLSLGNQQRVQLAASLIHDPEVLVLDEPFSGLDPVAVDVMSDLLLERARAGVAVLFSSHQLSLVQRLCDRVGIINGGRIRAQGTIDELRAGSPLIYEIATDVPPSLWCPPTLNALPVGDGRYHVATGDYDPQLLLRAVLDKGPVESFTRYVPDLDELFKEVVSQ